MSESKSVVLVDNEGGVRTLCMNRPEVLNALSDELLDRLGEEAEAAARDEAVRCLVITAAGRAFCAGQDLDTLKRRMGNPDAPDLGEHLRDRYNPLIVTLRTMEKPVVASVNGVAAGAGCSLALACDVRVAGQSAGFILAFINVGLIPDAGATLTLPRLVGVGRATEMAFTGRKIGADEALQWGLVNRVVADDDLQAATTKLAQGLASLPTRAMGLTKRALNHGWPAALEDQLAYEAVLQATAARTEDHVEGVEAFLEKRPPQFQGK